MKNGKTVDWEARIKKLEDEVEKILLRLKEGPNRDWRQIVGSHENDPLFEEMCRLGQEIRQGKRKLIVRKVRRGKDKAKTTP